MATCLQTHAVTALAGRPTSTAIIPRIKAATMAAAVRLPLRKLLLQIILLLVSSAKAVELR